MQHVSEPPTLCIACRIFLLFFFFASVLELLEGMVFDQGLLLVPVEDFSLRSKRLFGFGNFKKINISLYTKSVYLRTPLDDYGERGYDG